MLILKVSVSAKKTRSCVTSVDKTCWCANYSLFFYSFRWELFLCSYMVSTVPRHLGEKLLNYKRSQSWFIPHKPKPHETWCFSKKNKHNCTRTRNKPAVYGMATEAGASPDGLSSIQKLKIQFGNFPRGSNGQGCDSKAQNIEDVKSQLYKVNTQRDRKRILNQDSGVLRCFRGRTR